MTLRSWRCGESLRNRKVGCLAVFTALLVVCGRTISAQSARHRLAAAALPESVTTSTAFSTSSAIPAAATPIAASPTGPDLSSVPRRRAAAAPWRQACSPAHRRLQPELSPRPYLPSALTQRVDHGRGEARLQRLTCG